MKECRFCSRQFRIVKGHEKVCLKNPDRVPGYAKGRKTSLKFPNAGRAGTPEKEILRKQRISEGMRTKAATCGGHRKGSGRGKKGAYQGFWCDSSWELAWVLYHVHNTKIPFTRNWQKFPYTFQGETRLWIPDFRYTITGHFVEVKGYLTPQAFAKINQFKYSLLLFGEPEMKPIIAWAQNKFGKDYLKMYDTLRGEENREGVPALP